MDITHVMVKGDGAVFQISAERQTFGLSLITVETVGLEPAVHDIRLHNVLERRTFSPHLDDKEAVRVASRLIAVHVEGYSTTEETFQAYYTLIAFLLAQL